MTAGIHIEPEWEKILEKLMFQRGIAILLGATDSGKSTFARYLVNRLVSANVKTSIVDSDVGQSTLGLPGTISLKHFNYPQESEEYYFEKIFFVGSTNPMKRLNLMIEGTKKMVDLCKNKSEVIVIDTTGLVAGEEGKALKIGKIRAIKPDHIIALQKGEELEHILTLLDTFQIHRLKVSAMVKTRDKEQRFRYRLEKFRKYFDKTRISEFFLSHKDARFYFPYDQKGLTQINSKGNLLIGLNNDEDTVALGIATEISKNSIQFLSPINSINNINKVIFGDIAIMLEYQ